MFLRVILFIMICTFTRQIYSLDDFFQLPDKSFDKIHSDEFAVQKKTFAESPSLFKEKDNFSIPKMIAFEDSCDKIRLTPTDIIKISEDLTFSDWGGKPCTQQVAEEDFTLSNDKIKKTEEQVKKKDIKFSRTSSGG